MQAKLKLHLVFNLPRVRTERITPSHTRSIWISPTLTRSKDKTSASCSPAPGDSPHGLTISPYEVLIAEMQPAR
jgi:hypothetical protein